MPQLHCKITVSLLLCTLFISAGCQSASMGSLFSSNNSSRKLFKQTASGKGEPAIAHAKPASAMAAENSSSLPQSSQQIVSDKLKSAETALAKKDYGKAQADYETVLRYRPDNAQANHGLAIIADQQGQFSEAEMYYLTALKLDPQNPDLLANLGYSYLLQKKYDLSEEYLRHALEISPKHKKAAVNLGDLYAFNGQQVNALTVYRMVYSETDAQQHLKAVLSKETTSATSDRTLLAESDRKPPNKLTKKLLTEMEAAREADLAKREQLKRDEQLYNLQQAQSTQSQAYQDYLLQQQMFAAEQGGVRQPSLNTRDYPAQAPQYAQQTPAQNSRWPAENPTVAPNPNASLSQGNALSYNSSQPPGDFQPASFQPHPGFNNAPVQQAYQQNSQPVVHPTQQNAICQDQQCTPAISGGMGQTTPWDQVQAPQHQPTRFEQTQANPFTTPWPANAQSTTNLPHSTNQPSSQNSAQSRGQLPPGYVSPFSQAQSPQFPSQTTQAQPPQNAFEQAQIRAMQMGMNVGSGQMFPMQNPSQGNGQNSIQQPHSTQYNGVQINAAPLGQQSPLQQGSPQAAPISMPGSQSFLQGSVTESSWTRQSPDLIPQAQAHTQFQTQAQTQAPIQNTGYQTSASANPGMNSYEQTQAQHQQQYMQAYQHSALSPAPNHLPSLQTNLHTNSPSTSYEQMPSWQDHIYRQHDPSQLQNNPQNQLYQQNQPINNISAPEGQSGQTDFMSTPSQDMSTQGMLQQQRQYNQPPQWNPTSSLQSPSPNFQSNSTSRVGTPGNMSSTLPVVTPTGSNATRW